MSIVSVHALDGGHLTIPERYFVVPFDPEAKSTVPSLCFLIQRTESSTAKTTRIVFDLGLRRELSWYPPALQTHIQSRQPISSNPDVAASLQRGNLTSDDIDKVIVSHVHYDHVGYPQDFSNPNTTFIIGPGASDLLSGKTSLNIGSHSFFEADLLPPDRTIELPSSYTWKRFGHFPETIDLFSDSSVFIINAPGHLPGHLNLLCRISTSPLKYVYLAGDACHDMRLFTGEREIATWTDAEGRYCCIHADIEATKETLRRMRVAKDEGVEGGELEVVFAHNPVWEREARDRGRFWPGKL
jgi:glyoxylase-like metal-dependent hydrolase (beta-lactamase superfamily II)